jgi:arylsulfatase B
LQWDAGIATPDHTPAGRGFDDALSFAEHMVDTWTGRIFPGGTACTLVNASIVDLWDGDGPATAAAAAGGFLEDVFAARILAALNATAAAGAPAFLYYAPKATHYPLMVPAADFAAAGFVGPDDEPDCNATAPYIWPGQTTGYACRRQGAALLRKLDGAVGAIAAAARAVPGLWDRTLLVFSSDNGAPLDVAEAGGGNFPLRGGKYAPWEGGIRVPTFISGGFVPAPVRGVPVDGAVHLADWYATLAGLAGVDPTDTRAAAAGLPPIDSLDVWPLLSGANDTSPRAEIPVAPGALISWPFKLVRGPTWWSGWSGPTYPNASSPGASPDVWAECGAGCLFDLEADAAETTDLAPAHPAVVAALGARLDALEAAFWTNNDTGVDACPPGTLLCGCWAAVHTWGGFLGPYQV